ncbi:MAG: hypothetical protein KC620_21735 [Myxococcales bacterium]|nr:hypothetical protein [Myxococcales bacterium]
MFSLLLTLTLAAPASLLQAPSHPPAKDHRAWTQPTQSRMAGHENMCPAPGHSPGGMDCETIWRQVEPGANLCFLHERKSHTQMKVFFTFYVADKMQRRTTCTRRNGPPVVTDGEFKWRKHDVGRTSCSYFTGLTRPRECEQRIMSMFNNLAPRFPPLPGVETGRDVCPRPLL